MDYQINYITKNCYNGRNQGELLAEKNNKGYESNEWLTFLQAQSAGRLIKKGSKSVAVFKGFQEFTEFENDKIKTVSRPVGFARVFNLDQTELINK